MGQGKKIIVNQGAKLLVDGGKITSLCNDVPWAGIYVHGNASAPQPVPSTMPALNQSGVVYIDNFSIIEHASTAISTSAPGLPWLEQVARYGGVVFARESKFINNRKAIEFMPYAQDNQSQFIGCRFEEDGNWADNTEGVTIWGFTVLFQNCTFLN